MPTPTTTIAARIRQATAWWPGHRTARITQIRCPHCKTMRPVRHYRRRGGGCHRCIGTG